jgi:hypothetical protein
MRQVIAVMALGLALLVSGCNGREQRLTEQGNALIERIDAFQKATHRLPENLRELGLEEKMEGPLYYQKVSADHYIVSFGTTVGHSMIYRSEKRAWDDH